MGKELQELQEFRSCRMGSAIFRTLRGRFFGGMLSQALRAWHPGTLCLATIMLSLRDKKPAPGIFPFETVTAGLELFASQEDSTKWLSII